MEPQSENTTSNSTPNRGLNITALKEHVISHKIDVALWAIRILTFLFTIGYLFPIFGNANSCYYKALLANAATSALRLHQRLGMVRFNTEFLRELFKEDSCHYLFYSLIYLYVAPVTLVLVPVVLFAILHAASYSLTLLDTMGQNSWWGARLLISIVEFQSRNILRLAAFTEIMLMPLTVILILMGKAGLLTPFIYYHFLVQRYTSRRNPYTKNMFHELRVWMDTVAAKPSVPGIVKNFLKRIVDITCRLAPPMQAPQPHQQ
ncbi:Krueppel homolog 2 [Onthophagus taurus]|uniref:Krueppel homolog 2 n=1 Tax=Onthophagus taurus TaxID=166361 RepID=UPI000C20AFE6|nr:Krueppel homolog 2 [Onthophagus taurus]